MRQILLFALFFLALAAPAGAAQVPSAFVPPAWLQKHLADPTVRVIEVSSTVSFEFDGHVPGAALTTKGEWRVDEADGVYVHRPVDQLQDMIRQLGVNAGDAVVIYGKGVELDDLLGAGYLFWVFHYLGHDNVALLDEGWSGWLAGDGPVEMDAPAVSPGTFTAQVRKDRHLTTDDLLARYQTATLVDARPATHFAGTTKFPANSKYGRIAGSISQPWPENIVTDMEGRLFMASSPPRLVNGGTLNKDQEILITCFGGTGAALAYVLLTQYGYTNLRVHDAGLRRWNVRDLPLVKD